MTLAATAEVAHLRWLDPVSGRPLRPDRPWSLADGHGSRWPIVAGLPYLRAGRDDLRRRALEALDRGDERAALVILLADQDDYARTPPPDPATLSRLVDAVDDGSATLRDAMGALNYGPVADYFAHRWSSPTYLSGLALLDRHVGRSTNVVEIACGLGHFLRDLAIRGVPCLGLDVVFSKLWLARRFVVPPPVALACADAVRGWPLGPIAGPAAAFCHDAFYFLPDKPRVVAAVRETIGAAGTFLVGHAHNADFDHRGVAGEPKTPREYADLLPGCRMFDDAELARSIWSGEPAPPRDPDELGCVEAVAMAWWPAGRSGGPAEGPRLGLDVPPAGTALRRNPLLDASGSPRWPSPRFEAEYAGATGYLESGRRPLPPGPWAAGQDPEVDRLARNRILLDLPERW